MNNYAQQAIRHAAAGYLTLLLLACGGRQDDSDPSLISYSPTRFEEGDSLQLSPGQAPGLRAWINYHQASDTALRLSNCPASGVVIHLDPLDTLQPWPGRRFQGLLAFSPDSSLSIDIWHYNHVVDTTTDGHIRITGGGPEQQVVLADTKTGRRWSLLFNGTGQLVESADWLDDNTFVLGMMLTDEATGDRTPDIMLFGLADSTFTDFRYIRALSGDSPPPTPGGFQRHWLHAQGLKTEYP